MQISMEKSYNMEECEDIANNEVSAMDYGEETYPRNVAFLDVLENFQQYHPAEGMNDKVASAPTNSHDTAESETAPTIGGMNAATTERLSRCKRTGGGIDSENPPTKRSIDSYSSSSSESYKNLANEDEPQRRLAWSTSSEDTCWRDTFVCAVGTPFGTGSDLLQHKANLIECPPKSEQSETEGIGPEQEKQLRSRQRQQLSSKERWFNIFHILFPEIDESQYTFPYYDYTISAEREDSCSNIESEIRLILQEKLEEVAGKIACGVLSSLPCAQIGSVVSEPSDTSRKLKPDVSKEIKQICDLEHKAAVQGMAVDIIRSVKGRKLEVSERRADIIFEDSRLTGTDVEDSRIFDHSFHWDFMPTPEDLWLTSPAFPGSIPLKMNVPSKTGSLAQSHPISDYSWLER
ncbi:hypothetical protein SUNI508_06694 [Seiridium unicorne]|uniref:Uncharacterized protein n=1 Tax=Seiridium unicorne TaxID=138068 RepID=A0ABR2V014_9PEZI